MVWFFWKWSLNTMLFVPLKSDTITFSSDEIISVFLEQVWRGVSIARIVFLSPIQNNKANNLCGLGNVKKMQLDLPQIMADLPMMVRAWYASVQVSGKWHSLHRNFHHSKFILQNIPNSITRHAYSIGYLIYSHLSFILHHVVCMVNVFLGGDCSKISRLSLPPLKFICLHLCCWWIWSHSLM